MGNSCDRPSSYPSFLLYKIEFHSGTTLKSRKKRQAKTLLLRTRSTPYRTCGSPGKCFSSVVPPQCHLCSYKQSFRCGCALRIRKQMSSKTLLLKILNTLSH